MRFKRYLLPTALAALALALVIAPDVLAQNFGLDAAAGKSIPKTTDIAAIIARILRLVVGFVGTIFLLLMVYSGFLWMTARGDSKKIDTAKQLIIGAIIGIFIIGAAYAITAIVIATASGDASTLGSGDSGADSQAGDADTPDDITICFDDSDCPGGMTCQNKNESGEGTCQ